ncbi:restriction endonuclease subunit S [Aeromonas veronii]|uniref:restriction endonuclease subunit S n=1 Tax=Aeromonas veronii TaxID=654 RepID=UPI00187E1257|nr:restriction endonuclease subunit S [Aeromonas veronii]MBE8736005.1 restriction endonuclease subunit S [Aeromonas veronii]MBE8739179.1 restriction endonuclease subunit S [Aeromonas veronii]MBE8744542.1 restriction endonuclease subunit S [Aeromonas veronii]MBE8763523.1 restriction endonuclease subunit S [Aeromonas veronii]MBE8839901.1 restriction endonuclease subunit S [Aeromonas veronii]
MGSNWKTTKLLDHYDIRSGLSKPAKDFGSGYPFLTFKDVFYNYFTPDILGDLVQSNDKERASSSVKRGDVFLTRTSETMHELGMSCVALKDYENSTFNGFCKRLRPHKESELVPEYVGYYLRSSKFRQSMLAFSTMSTRASLNNEMIGRLEISYPSKNEQLKIAKILKTLDDKVALNRQINQTLEQMAQALFKSWFVDFDPVVDNALDAGFFELDLAFPDELLRRAEARRAVRERGDFKPLPEATRQLFPAAFEECSEPFLGLGGWLPQGWKIAMLDEITCELRRGVSPKYVEEGGVQVINQKCIRNHEVSYEPARRHNHEAKKIDGRELCIGDVLVNSTGVGTLGRIAQVTHLPETTVVDSHVTVVRVKDDVCPIYTFGQLMLSMEGKIEQLGEGSTGQTELSRKILSEQLVILPPFDIAAHVEKTFKSLSEKQVSNRKQCSTLTNLRDTLLPKLISGELRLDQIEAGLAKEGMA